MDYRRSAPSDQLSALAERLREMHPADAAEMLRHLDDDDVAHVLLALPKSAAALIAEELGPERMEQVVPLLGRENTSELLEEMSSDDVADLLAELGPGEATTLLEEMEEPQADRVRTLLAYPEGTAGALAATEVVALRRGMTAQEALQALRKMAPDAETVYYVYVVDDQRFLFGVISLRDLILLDPGTSIDEIVNERVVWVRADEDQEAVARVLKRYGLLALPVVDQGGRLVGVVTVDDVMDVVQEEAAEDIYKLSGVGQEPTERIVAPVHSALLRLPWLLLAILIELIGARVIEGYQSTLRAMIALAYFISVLNSMAGNLGIQSVALIVRAFARGEIEAERMGGLIGREIAIAAIIAGASAALGGAVALGWQGAPLLAGVVAVSMVLALLVASTVGVVMPVFFTRLGRDPAIASGPLVTSSLDLTTVTIYLTVATVLLAWSAR